MTFEQATGVFNDPMALTVYDDKDSSGDEDRWITLGQVDGQHYLVVVHTYREQNSDAAMVRLISASPATQHEIRQYEG